MIFNEPFATGKDMEIIMADTKKRRDIEIYEEYWHFTAAHTDIFGTKFNNCLNVIVRYIDDNIEALKANADKGTGFSKTDLYKNLQNQIIAVSGFKGKNSDTSARKVINQFVKIGFIYPFLTGYHLLVKRFILETDKSKKQILFSKIFYEASSLASDVTKDNRNIKHVEFLLKTLDSAGSLSKKDIMALMITDITRYKKGYLTREEIDLQRKYAEIIKFDERKYNQISHLIKYLKNVPDLVYDRNEERFWFADDPEITDRDFNASYKRDGVKHRIYKQELKQESKAIYGAPVCYLDKKKYNSLIASHIKPCADCLKECREDQAYDVNNGLLLSPTADSYFDKNDITFDDNGKIIIGKRVDESVKADLEKFSLDKEVLNNSRKEYLANHRILFAEKNGD